MEIKEIYMITMVQASLGRIRGVENGKLSIITQEHSK